MSIQVICNQMIIFFLLIFTGYYLSRIHMIGDGENKFLCALISNVLNPALILSGCMTAEAGMGEMAQAFMVAVLLYAALIALSRLLPVLLGIEKGEKRLFELICIFGNIGFIGIPLVSAVIGSDAVVFVSVHNIFFNILIYTYGVKILRGDSARKEEASLISKLISPGTVASVLGLLIFVLRIKCPEVLVSAVTSLGNATSALAMIAVGYSLSGISWKSIFNDIRLYLFCILRFVVLPVALGMVMKPMHLDPTVYNVSILMSAVPVANFPVILARNYDINADYAVRGVLLSTILSVITIPLVVTFL